MMRGRSVPAYVVGEGNTDLTRALGLAGIRSVAMASATSATRFSRFVIRRLPEIDPWIQPDRLVETLVRNASQEDDRPVLIYQGDGNALMVSRYREQLDPYFRFAIPTEELTEQVNDKRRFHDLATRMNLPVPAAIFANPLNDPMPSLPFDFPVVVKPASRRVDRWSLEGGKAALVGSRDELERLWSGLARQDAHFVVQELIAGPESAVVSYHAYVSDDGTLVGEFTGEKIRTRPSSFGHSCSVKVVTLPEVAELGRELLGRLGITGVIKFDFKKRADGTLWLFETNTKFNLWHLPGAIAGVNIPALAYDYLMGNERTVGASISREGVIWCKVWDDLPVALQEGVSLVEWLRWIRSVDSVRDVALNDPLPLLGVVLTTLRRVLGRVTYGSRRLNSPAHA
jgi:D-aspartate ligase